MFLLVEVLLAGVLLFGVLLVAEEEMVLAVSGLLEKKGMILLGSETLGEEEVLLSSGASLVIRCSWNLFSSVDWIGGHRQLYFWSLPICQCAITTTNIS